ncbi:shikimate dehydrogenase [Amorphus sp. MBR-141]
MSDDLPRAAVIGWPVAHSRSPLIHGHWLKSLGIPGSYDRIAVPPEAADGFFRDFRSSGLTGANVTLPHKIRAASACAGLSEAARAMGAVNTLWWEGDRLLGDNTDAYGFLANLDQRLPGWSDAPATALVLGAGGAARAVVYGLVQRGFRVVVANRTAARTAELAALFPGAVAGDWAAAMAPDGDTTFVVNTTSLGMGGGPDLPIDLARLEPEAIVTDIVYTPVETGLLTRARAAGLRTVDGLGMLLHQAVPGFERWFGVRPEVTEDLRARVLDDIGAPA